MFKKKERKYPYIGRSMGNSAKIFFIAPCIGYQLHEDQWREPGYYAETWSESIFRPLNKHLGDNHAL